MAKESHVSTASAPSLTVTILSEVGRILGGPNMKTLANQRGVLGHVTPSPPMRAHLVRGPGGQHLAGHLAEVAQHAQLTLHHPGSYSYLTQLPRLRGNNGLTVLSEE